MDWIYLPTSTLDSEEFVGAEPIERATWLCLLRYCIGQENGGAILACGDWSDRKWQQLARVTKAEVMTESRLWTWWNEGQCIRVWGYPLDKQERVQRLRSLSQKAVEAKQRKRLMRNGEHPPKPRKQT